MLISINDINKDKASSINEANKNDLNFDELVVISRLIRYNFSVPF